LRAQQRAGGAIFFKFFRLLNACIALFWALVFSKKTDSFNQCGLAWLLNG
jgi:hypothetical protein